MVEYIYMISKRIKDMTGLKFGRLTVINFSYNKGTGGHSYWMCKCKCGKNIVARGSHLRVGQTKSCGCLAGDIGRKFLKVYANSDAHKGKGNPAWKGKNTKYSSIHSWLTNNYEKKSCEVCGSIKNLDWALIKGKVHDHDRSNYMVLCRSHHIKYDRKK